SGSSTTAASSKTAPPPRSAKTPAPPAPAPSSSLKIRGHNTHFRIPYCVPGIRMSGGGEAELPDQPEGFGDDGAAHLALADAAVGEGDGDLDDGVAAAEGAKGQLDLEGVAGRADGGEVEVLEHFAA